MAGLLVDVLAENRRKRRFLLHEFVIMPNHFHLLLTPAAEIPLEKALQFIKGGFSYRAKKEIHFAFEIWQASFVNHLKRGRHAGARSGRHSRRRGLQTPPHLHSGESGQSGLKRETGAVRVVIGVSGDGIGPPATRAKALNLFSGEFSRV
jgi:hypothetical protein